MFKSKKLAIAFFVACLLVSLMILLSTGEKKHLSQSEAADSIATALINEGWSERAAYVISGFETDLLDESDSLLYVEYIGYKED